MVVNSDLPMSSIVHRCKAMATFNSPDIGCLNGMGEVLCLDVKPTWKKDLGWLAKHIPDMYCRYLFDKRLWLLMEEVYEPQQTR